MRLMAVCHDSVGIGHLRRTLAIAERVTQTMPSCRALVVSGTLHVTNFGMPERTDYVKLPSICKGPDHRYCAKSLGVSLSDVVSVRSALLTATAASYRPDVLLVDKSPLGVHGEMETALRLVRDRYPATRVIFGMRDIEDAPERTVQEWRRGGHIEGLQNLVDEIWVYGDRQVFDVAEAYRLPRDIVEKLHYVGYIARPVCEHGDAATVSNAAPVSTVAPVSNRCPGDLGDDEHGSQGGNRCHKVRRVLVTVGGGTDGYRLLDQYLSKPLARVDGTEVHTTIIGGPDLPRRHAEEFRRRASSFGGVEFRDAASCMFCEYRRADAVLCMGGYNTMVELLQADRPMVVYPRVEPRLEQYIRARRFAALGLCEALDPDCMTPQTVHDAVAAALTRSGREKPVKPDLDGLTNVARRLAQWEASSRDALAVFV